MPLSVIVGLWRTGVTPDGVGFLHPRHVDYDLVRYWMSRCDLLTLDWHTNDASAKKKETCIAPLLIRGSCLPLRSTKPITWEKRGILMILTV